MQSFNPIQVCLLTIFFICADHQRVSAQESKPPKSTKATLLKEYAQDDTSQALINLFYRKRIGAITRGMGGGLAVARIATSKPSGHAQQIQGSDQTPQILLGSIIALPFIITSITSGIKYKQETLLELLASRQQNESVPAKYRNKLKRKDFNI